MGTLDEAFEHPLDNEIENLALNNLDYNDLDLNDADAEMLHVLIPGADEPLDESVISIPERLKRAQRMRRLAKHNAMLRKLKSTRMAPRERILARARKAALLGLRLRIAGKAVKSFDKLSINQKMQIDQQLQRRYPGAKLHATIDRIAKKLLPRVQKKEMDRLMKARSHVHEGNKADEDMPALGDPLIDPLKIDPLKIDPLQHIKDQESEMARRKRIKFRRDILEARKSSYDTEGGNEGDDHIINQLRKASMARGEHMKIKWKDGHESVVHPHHAKMGLHAYASIVSKSGPGHMGKDRQNFVKKLGHSEDSFYDSIGLSEDQKYTPKMKNGKKESTKVEKFPKGLQDTAKPFLQLPGKSAQMPYGVGPSIGAISVSASNTFGESVSPAEARKEMQDKRVPIKNAPIPAPKAIKRTKSAQALLAGHRQYTTKPFTSGQRRTPNAIRGNARRGWRGNVSEANINKLGVAQNMLKLATTPRPNETPEEHKKRRAELEARVKKLGGKLDEALRQKALKNDFDPQIIAEVFLRGFEESLDEQQAFNRVNSFISGGFAAELDMDLMEAQKTVWIPSTTKRKGYYRTVQYEPGSGSKKTSSQRRKTKVLDEEIEHRLGAVVIQNRGPTKPKKVVTKTYTIKADSKETAAAKLRQRLRSQGHSWQDIYHLKEEHGAGEIGTPEATERLASDTPGQSINRDDRYMAKLPWEESDSQKELGKSVKSYDEVKKSLSGSLQEGFDAEQAHRMLHAAGFNHASTVTDSKGRESRLYRHKSGKIVHMNCGEKHRADYVRFHHDKGTTSAATMSGFKKGLEEFV